MLLTAHGRFDRRAYEAAPDTLHHALFARGKKVPVVAYHPALSRTPSPLGHPDSRTPSRTARPALELPTVQEWRSATLQGLPAAALVAGRALAYPHVPCASPWLSRQPAAGATWTQRSCRTGLCGEWRVTAVGYTSAAEASARAAMRAAHPSALGAALPADLPLTCDVHANMVIKCTTAAAEA
ncbi:hypothetical protein T492DRAFT_217866 [Pavlovales sp. CCMP2436]|nr:hypothetical protein T492DRAFT_217866 [Pavlovales sp. CCMP2436]